MCINRFRENIGFYIFNFYEIEGKNIVFYLLLLRCFIVCNMKFLVVLSYVVFMQYIYWVMYIFQVLSKEGLCVFVLCFIREFVLQIIRELKKLIVGIKFCVRVMIKVLVLCNDFLKLFCDIFVFIFLRLDVFLKELKIDLSK